MTKIGNIELGKYPVLLAPMENVTDPPYRAVCKPYGADVVYTEFISCDGLHHDAKKSLRKLIIYDSERPVGIQIYGTDPKLMAEAAQLATESNPDFIDINFGCPVKKIAARGAGSGIFKNIPLMYDITKEVVKATHIPVTLKTRLGWDDDSKVIDQIAEQLQDCGIAALTIHGRTRAQMYKGEADWTLIGKIKDNPRITIPVIGNGDIDSPEKAAEMFHRYGVDGIMIGRAAIGTPWLFRDVKNYLENKTLLPPPSLHERVSICLDHLQKSVEWKGERTAVLEMRSHHAGYFKSIPNFKPWRTKLMTLNSFEEVHHLFSLLDEFGVERSDVLSKI